MGPQLSVNLWHIAPTPIQRSTNRLLQIFVPKLEVIGAGPSMPKFPAVAA